VRVRLDPQLARRDAEVAAKQLTQLPAPRDEAITVAFVTKPHRARTLAGIEPLGTDRQLLARQVEIDQRDRRLVRRAVDRDPLHAQGLRRRPGRQARSSTWLSRSAKVATLGGSAMVPWVPGMSNDSSDPRTTSAQPGRLSSTASRSAGWNRATTPS
jgi:hypothetical protein